MTQDQSSNDEISLDNKIDKLEFSISNLLKYCEELVEENSSIKHSYDQLMLERSELQTKNDKVRGQVEAMVERLKAMDKAS